MATTVNSPTSSSAFTCAGVQVHPGAALRDLVKSKPEGTTFCIHSGTYRLTQSIRPKRYDKFLAEPGTVFNGSRVLTSFTKPGKFWIASNQTQQASRRGKCEPEITADSCLYPEDVYFDGRSLWQVTSLARLSSGKFYFDYANNKIFLADNPTGHRVEATIADKAFAGGGKFSPTVGVTVRGFIVERFSNPAGGGAILSGPGWTITNNEVTQTHGVGIAAFGNTVVRNNHIHHNGQMGVAAQGANNLFEGNEIDHNNTQGFRYAWEAGGSKFWFTTNLVVRDNYSHDNTGIGLWTDTNNVNTVYEGNRVENNSAQGIFIEKSYDTILRNNIISGNGYEHGGVDGAGIKVSSSPNVEIYGNTLTNNGSGILFLQLPQTIGNYGELKIHDAYVHDNIIRMPQGRTGLIQKMGDNSYFTSKNNRFERNTYCLGTDPTQFEWMNDQIASPEWTNHGHDDTAEASFTSC